MTCLNLYLKVSRKFTDVILLSVFLALYKLNKICCITAIHIVDKHVNSVKIILAIHIILIVKRLMYICIYKLDNDDKEIAHSCVYGFCS